MKTPASAAAGPTVGANCRGCVTADAIGWLKMWGRWTLEDPGRACTHEHAHKEHNTHGFTQVRGSREEITPLLLPV